MTSFSRQKMFGVLAGLFGLIHALYWGAGIRFDMTPLPYYWQYLDVELLTHKLCESLWYLHAQPPLFNLFLGLVLKLAPEHHELLFHATSLLGGFGGYLCLYALQRRFGISRSAAVAFSTLFIASPSFVLYEHWLFYTFPLTCLLLLAHVCLAEWRRRGQDRYLWLFSALLFILGATRSLFHLIYYIGATIILLGYAERRAAVIRIMAAAFLLLFLLYVKNYVVFGTFSTSTWMGMNLYAVTTDNLPDNLREALIKNGRLSELANVKRFQPLDAYPLAYRELRDSRAIEVLNRPMKSTNAPNFHHIAYIPIAERYQRDALYVMRHFPQYALLGLAKSWFVYFKASSDYSGLSPNLEHIPRWNAAVEKYVYGKLLIDPSAVMTPSLRTDTSYHHYLYLTLALGLPLLLVYAVWRLVFGNARFSIEQRLLFAFLCFNILYVACIGNLLEMGENNRFRFMSDPLYLVIFAMFVEQTAFPYFRNLFRAVQQRKHGSRRRLSLWLVVVWVVCIHVAFYGSIFLEKGAPRLRVIFLRYLQGSQ